MRRTLLSLTFLVALSSVAYAEPLVITGGTATILGPAAGPGVASLNLLAAGFSATGEGERNSGGLTIIRGSSTFRGSVMNNGTVLVGVFNDNTVLNFTLAPFTRPDPNSTSDTAFVTTAFTMTGNLTLVAFAPGQPVIFSMAISGSGFAGITYARTEPGGAFFATDIVYNFEATQPVPEPTTLTLLGAGLAGIAAKVRRRRKAVGGA